MHTRRWIRHICLVLVLVILFDLVGMPLATVRWARRAAEALARATDATPVEQSAAALRALQNELSPEVLAAPLQHDPGDTASEMQDEDTCKGGGSGGSLVEYTSGALHLGQWLESVGPPFLLRYESRYERVPKLLHAWIPTAQPIDHWEMRIQGWTFEGEGNRVVAFWDTTEKPGGQPVPEGVYYAELTYENELGVGNSVHPVIVKRLQDGPVGYGWSHNYQLRLESLDERTLLLKGFGFWSLYNQTAKGVYAPCCSPGDQIITLEGGGWRWERTGADGTGLASTVDFDAQGRAIRYRDGNGRGFDLAYDAQGRLTSVTDDQERTTSFHYDEDGHLVTIRDVAGGQWELAYQAGNLIGVTDPLGGRWSYRYDDAHRLVAKVDPRGYETLYAYDADGAITTITDPAGSTLDVDIAYETEPYIVEDPSQAIPTLGKTVLTRRDASGTVTSVMTVTFDIEEHITTVVQSPDGGSTQYVSRNVWGTGKDRGRLLETIDPLGRVTRYTYEGSTHLVTSVEREGRPKIRAGYRYYDGVGWRLRSALTEGLSETRLDYDDAGLLQRVHRGEMEWFYTYDDPKATHNQPTAMIWNWDGRTPLAQATDARITHFRYDRFGRLIEVIDPLERHTKLAYDDFGRLVALTFPGGGTERYTYDALSRVTAYTDALGQTTSYRYDAVGNLVSITDARGNAITFGYDYANRLVWKRDPLGREIAFGYDSAGRLAWRRDARGARVDFTSDDLGRITGAVFPTGERWQLRYDALGRITQLDNGTASLQFGYDRGGQLVRMATVRPGDTFWVSYEYGRHSLLTAMETSRGWRVTYERNGLGQITAVKTPLGQVSYKYDRAGQPIPRVVQIRSDRLLETRSYDPVGRLTRQVYTHPSWSKPITLTYTYDEAGNLASSQGLDGPVLYAYDLANRLVGVTYPGGREVHYIYDAAGNRTEVAGAQTVRYTYDAANQLLQAGEAAFSYDANGHLIGAWQGTQGQVYAWDYQGRLRGVDRRPAEALPYPLSLAEESPSAKQPLEQHRYDGIGRRLETQRADGRITNLGYDAHHPVMLWDRRGQTRSQNAYASGWDTLALTATGSQDTPWYPLTDANGTVLALVDEEGNVRRGSPLDAWGAPQGDDSKLPLAFQGRPYDGVTGLYDMRARWYDPSLGRFISPDPILVPMAPATLNGYAYGLNNPLRYSDPTGELVPLIIAGAIVGAAFYASYSAASYGFSTPAECRTWQGWAVATLKGAVVGAAVGAAGIAIGSYAMPALLGEGAIATIAGGAISGGVGGAIGNLAEQLILDPGDEFDAGSLVKSIIIGALLGGVAAGVTSIGNEAFQFTGDFVIGKVGGLGLDLLWNSIASAAGY